MSRWTTPLAAVVLVAAGIALAVILVGGEDSPGCGGDGAFEMTTYKDGAHLYEKATTASQVLHQVKGGCKARFVSYCYGRVHNDSTFEHVRDIRWLIRAGGEGLMPNGETVGQIPPDVPTQRCPGGFPAPRKFTFTRARISKNGRWVELHARAPRAAVIGFALRLPNGRWRRVGWDDVAGDDAPLHMDLFIKAKPGDKIVSIPCIGWKVPVEAKPKTLALKPGDVRKPTGPFVEQPVKATAVDAACDAGTPVRQDSDG